MYQTAEYKSTSWAQFNPIISGHSCTVQLLLCFYLLLVSSFKLSAQDSIQVPLIKMDTAIIYCPEPPNPKEYKERITDPFKYSLSKDKIRRRIKIMATTNIAGYSAAMIGLYAAWYKDYPQSNFHSFNDIGEWKGIDKIGHAYSAYAESKASMELWRWTGIGRNKRIWLGGMSGAFYQTVIETLDGFSSEWGWSWGDFSANVLGSGMLVAQEFAWDEQRIQFKFSFHRKKYADPTLNKRSDKIFGQSGAERFLKDYNGQTYWLSANLRSFFPKSKLPAWLQISLGSGAEGLFGANDNIGKDPLGNIDFTRTDIKRYRQWYLAPDIDLTKIKTRHKGIKVALNILNIVKFPMPSVEYSNGKFRLNALTF